MGKNKWLLDLAHSEIYFKVKHLMITTVTGYFRDFTVEAFTAGEDFNTVYDILFVATTDSIDTGNKLRDDHLRSADFFDAAVNKQIKFSGSRYEVNKKDGELYGDLTIRGITKPVIIAVKFGGIAVDDQGRKKAGFTIEGKINRKEFGLTWGAVTEAGHIVVSDEVKIHAEIQLIKQPPLFL